MRRGMAVMRVLMTAHALYTPAGVVWEEGGVESTHAAFSGLLPPGRVVVQHPAAKAPAPPPPTTLW